MIGVTRFRKLCSLFAFLLILSTALFKLQATSAILSPEGIFSLNGSDSLLTRQFSKRLSGYEKKFYQLTGYSPIDAPPVVVVLHDANDSSFNRAFLRMDTMEGNLPKIQLDVSEDSLSEVSTSAALAQSMLLRQYYDGKSPVAGSHIAEFPEWLLYGLGQLTDPRASLSVIPVSYLQGGTPPSIPDLLVQKISSESTLSLRDLYATMSAELLSAGLKNDGGDRTLRDWIGLFDPDRPAHELSSWPPKWSMQSVERRWLLLMAEQSGEQSGGVSLYSVGETVRRYDKIMEESTTGSHSLASIKKEKGSTYLIQQLLSRMIALRLQANSMANPLLDGTIQLCEKFKGLSEKKILEEEKKLSAKRDDIVKRSRSIEAYLDWYEATKLPGKSGLFDTLLKAPDTPVQQGPIGHYLDMIEKRGW
jgi:hypothetical protein